MCEESRLPVSIIVPCYNGERWLDRLLESICAQTYRPIELIVVNDGSTDQTGEKLTAWADPLSAAGIGLRCIHQANAGVSAAMNAGLAVFSGAYLCWVDSDDALTPDSVAEKVRYLEEHPGCRIVTTDAYWVPEDDPDQPVGLMSVMQRERFAKNQFMRLINEASTFCPLCHMMRRETFFETHPDGQIFPSRFGQNWQMLLPVYYRYPRGYLDKPLGYYSVRPDSHSRGDDTLEKCMRRLAGHYEILEQTIRGIAMPEKERERYLTHIRVRYARKRLRAAGRYHDRALLEEQMRRLRALGAAKATDWFRYVTGRWRMLNQVYQIVKLPVKRLLTGPRNRM